MSLYDSEVASKDESQVLADNIAKLERILIEGETHIRKPARYRTMTLSDGTRIRAKVLILEPKKIKRDRSGIVVEHAGADRQYRQNRMTANADSRNRAKQHRKGGR